MHERSAKGIHLAPLVKILKWWRKENGVAVVPGLPEQHRALLMEERIMSASWYPFDALLAALRAVHHLVFDDRDEGLVILGRGGAKASMTGAYMAQIKDTPADTMRAFARTWSSSFDFGRVESDVDERSATITFRDYADIGRAHAMLHMGWLPEMVEMAGGRVETCEPLNAPWEDPAGGDFVVRITWARPEDR